MTENEVAAESFGKDRKAVLKSLKESRLLLDAGIRKHFGKGVFDFESKELIGDNPQLVLQWRMRPHPDQPISYENQQCRHGIVILCLRN